MKTLRFLFVSFLLMAFVSTAFSQGKKSTFDVPYPWDEELVPISCIGPYDGIILMQMTFFDTGKVLNKASGEITASDGKVYTVDSKFNCNLFSARISASVLSVQSMTFRVRCKETGKLVATVHFTWHYNTDGVEENPYMVNTNTVCH